MMWKGTSIFGLVLALVCAVSSESGEVTKPEPECDPETEFACADGNGCIYLNYRCDGGFDCADKSDESEETCKGNCAGIDDRFACANGQCLRAADSACSGVAECEDGSDEDEKLCSDCNGNADRWKCKGSTKCINERYRCDSDLDCGEDDPSDEDASVCGDNCGGIEGRFKCGNNKCLYESKVCDGYNQCDTDESDETCASCNGHADRTKCTLSTRCFLETDKCDGYKDCALYNDNGDIVTDDNTDEENCPVKNESSEAVFIVDEPVVAPPTEE